MAFGGFWLGFFTCTVHRRRRSGRLIFVYRALQGRQINASFPLDALPETLKGFGTRARRQAPVISQPAGHRLDQLFGKTICSRFCFPGTEHTIQPTHHCPVIVATIGF
jgi:hypothetical protein